MAKNFPGFGGMGGLGNLGQIMKQAQKAAEQMKGLEEELGSQRVEGTAGGGVVKVTASGAGEIVGVQIAPEVVDPEDVEMLEDLVLSAIREAQEQATKLREEKVSDITGGVNLPKGLLGG